MTEDTFKIRIDELELQLESKDKEIIGYLKKIEHLEDTIIRLEALIPDEIRKDLKVKGKIGGDSKLAIEMSDLEKQVRDLKDKMGFLRKEIPDCLRNNLRPDYELRQGQQIAPALALP